MDPLKSIKKAMSSSRYLCTDPIPMDLRPQSPQIRGRIWWEERVRKKNIRKKINFRILEPINVLTTSVSSPHLLCPPTILPDVCSGEMRVQIFENRPGTPLPPENAVMFATTEANARHFFRPPCLSKMNNLDRIDVIALSTGDSNITTSSNNLEEIDRLPLYYRDFGIKDCLSLSLNDIYSGNDNLHDDDDEYLEIYRNLKTPLQDSPQQPGVFSRSARKVIIMLKFLSSINKSQQDGMASSDSSLSIPIDTD